MGKKFGADHIEKQLAGVPLRSGPPTKNAGKPGAKGAGKSNYGRVEKGGPQRLQRLLASAGYGSRRQCEELIKEGRVEVEGLDVIELGTQVDPQTAKVFVDGNLLKQQRLVYFLLNKPPGVVTSNKDPQGRTLVVDLIKEPERVFPVGRLDRNSEGLLLLTNDGDLAQQLAHPKYGVRKIYRVTVAGKIDSEKLSSMKKGVYIAEGHVAVDGAKILRHRAKSTELEIVLREGKNREIRRILARLGHKVMSLQRIAIGPLRMADLPRGAYRPLKGEELRRLREEVFYQSRAAKARKEGDVVEDRAEPEDEPREKVRSGRPKSSQGKAGKRATGGGFKSSDYAPKKGTAGRSEVKKTGPVKKASAKKKSATGDYGLGRLDLGLEGSKRVGTVIGDDSPPRTKLEKKPAGKKAGKRAGGGKKVLKRSAKKSDSKPTGKRSIKRKKG